MTESIIDGTKFNVQNIKYTVPKANSSGGKGLSILNKPPNTGSLKISTPVMLTWGASDFEGNGKFELSLQFPNEDFKNADTDSFLANMIALESKIKADALINSKDWFGKQHKSADVVDALFSPMLKYTKNKVTGDLDPNKPPCLRVKIPIWEGVWKCTIFNEDYEQIFPDSNNVDVTPVQFLKKQTNVACLLQCGGLWFANGKFGVTWKLIQAVTQKSRDLNSGRCLLKLSSTDEAKLRGSKQETLPEVAPLEQVKATTSTLVEDSDVEEEDEVEPEPQLEPVKEVVAAEPEPEPLDEEPASTSKVVKKKVLKKKVAE